MSAHGYETISIETASARLEVDVSVISRWIEEGHILFVRGPSNEPLLLTVPFARFCQRLGNRTSVKDMERSWHSLA